MNTIKFPGLNLELQISKIAFSIGKIEIYWYAILMVFAFLMGILILKIRKNKFDINFDDVLNLMIVLIPISIISARIYYILFKLNYYIKAPIQIFNLRNGGLAIYGGIIGGVIYCYIYCKKKKIDFINLLDFVVPSLSLRTVYWKMGKFYKYRSIWIRNFTSVENGDNGSGKIYRSTSHIFI